MTACDHDELFGDATCPACGFNDLVNVSCDQNCLALLDPQTVDAHRAAVDHWRFHSRLGGCSHGH